MVSTRSVAVAPSRKLPGQLHADHLRDQHGNRLPQHRGLGFNAAHAPAQHAQPVDHGGVRVGAYQRVGIGGAFAVGFLDEDHARQIFQIHLVHDAGVGRHDGQIAEGGLAPAQEGVALFVALEFQLGVELERLRRAEFVHLHRVIDDQLGGLQGIDQRGIAAQLLHGVAHGGQVDHRGDAGEILQQHAAGREGDFLVRLGFAVPGRQGADVVRGHVAAVFGAQQIFQQNAQARTEDVLVEMPCLSSASRR